jgi:hypothetical protein
MGCDGGTIPTRDELVKLKKKPEQRDKDGHRLYKWQHCAISQQLLRKPVMACELGRLYNKESVIELLLNKDRSKTDELLNTAHIEKLKDVVELNLHDNPAFDINKQSVGDGLYNDALISPWICPVTGLEMNGRFKFVFGFINGKVVAERAIKVLRKDKVEGQHYKEEDIVTLNPEEEELDLMNSKMNARRARVKALKKAAKEAKRKNESDFKVPSSSKTVPEDGASAPKKLKAEELSAFKDQKKTNDPSKIKSSKPKSVQSDPNASEVYKKLFSTHKTALNQKQGNWVTFDPRYN